LSYSALADPDACAASRVAYGYASWQSISSMGGTVISRPKTPVAVLLVAFCVLPAAAQNLINASAPGEKVTLLPSDLATLEAPEVRRDLPCVVTPRKTDLGFDLRFHAGYDVSIPLKELEGDGEMLTVVFRVYAQGDKEHPAYFSQHIRVPEVDEDAKGDAMLQGAFDVGEGNYHVDWLMRDREERPCSSSWDTQAELGQKDQAFTLFIAPKAIAEAQFEPFRDSPVIRPPANVDGPVNVKLLVNFAPQSKDGAALAPVDLSAMVGILKTIEHDPRVGKLSLVAFNMQEHRVLYRQDAAEQINFPALGNALQSMKLGTVAVATLGEKNGDTDFLGSLIEKEVTESGKADAVIFAGPKAMLDADVPQDEIRRIGEIECPVFYMNYNPNPQQVPWRDSISHAVRVMKGTEFTITRPRDLWYATSEMMARVIRSKHSRSAVPVAVTGSR
jgi:hypothetical protein